jgi:N-acetyl-gamma-glutamyl-phosphate reductase
MVNAGIIAPDHPVTINALSGYTGGGNKLIAEFESRRRYGRFRLCHRSDHKHLPEIPALRA